MSGSSVKKQRVPTEDEASDLCLVATLMDEFTRMENAAYAAELRRYQGLYMQARAELARTRLELENAERELRVFDDETFRLEGLLMSQTELISRLRAVNANLAQALSRVTPEHLPAGVLIVASDPLTEVIDLTASDDEGILENELMFPEFEL